jgi:hypothetical protein
MIIGNNDSILFFIKIIPYAGSFYALSDGIELVSSLYVSNSSPGLCFQPLSIEDIPHSSNTHLLHQPQMN